MRESPPIVRCAAPEVHAKLTTDPTDGGYDYILELRGNATVANVWTWDDAQKKYLATKPMPAQAQGEAGKDVDPF